MGDNGGLSGHDNGRRFGDGDDAATKQLPKLLIAAEESPGLPVALPPQSSAPGMLSPMLADYGVQCSSHIFPSRPFAFITQYHGQGLMCMSCNTCLLASTVDPSTVQTKLVSLMLRLVHHGVLKGKTQRPTHC